MGDQQLEIYRQLASQQGDVAHVIDQSKHGPGLESANGFLFQSDSDTGDGAILILLPDIDEYAEEHPRSTFRRRRPSPGENLPMVPYKMYVHNEWRWADRPRLRCTWAL